MYTLKLCNIERTFIQGNQSLKILRNINISVLKGETVALIGPSGAGKTTILQIAGLLDSPSEGQIYIDGKECKSLNDAQRTSLRNHSIGFVYQYHHLLSDFTILENVMFPQLIQQKDKNSAFIHAKDLLKKMKLSHRLKHYPKQISGGEQQRVAIARALANNPKILLADEPTGNLDNETCEIVFTEMLSLLRSRNLSALIATHNIELAKRMDRILTLKDGILN